MRRRVPASGVSSRAFTLIELMTVIVIIGITTAMIIPEMRGTFEDALLRSTSRNLVSAFDLASSRAVSLNQPHRVRLDATSKCYLLERQVRQGSREEYVPVTDVSGCKGGLDSRISIEIRRADEDSGTSPAGAEPNPSDAIAFYADGTADAAVVVLKDRTGLRLGLRLNPITARVHVFEVVSP
jgi:prepilin-type N-terminal cleavage/methylation domain-containing protein